MNQNAYHLVRRILVGALGWVLLGCGSKTLDLGQDVGTPEYAPPDNGESDRPTTVPKWLAAHQYGCDALALDDTRVYWSTAAGPPPWRPDLAADAFVLRSCRKNDCAGTLVTYWQSQSSKQFQMTVNRTRVFWAESTYWGETTAILTCPIAGCDGRPAHFVVGGIETWALVADDSYVYWVSDKALSKCPVEGCFDGPTLMTPAAGLAGPGTLAASATHLYWSQQGAIMTAPKDGSSPASVIADGLHAPRSITVDAHNVYWAENYSFGAVKSCPLTGCMGAPNVLASNQRYPALLKVSGDRAYWFTSLDGPSSFWASDATASTQLVECSVKGCGSGPTMLAGAQGGPHGIAVDATHVYWTLFGEQVFGPIGFFFDGAVMRLRRSP
jgi:hypothetical protein